MHIRFEVENYTISSLAQCVYNYEIIIVENWCAMQLTD